VEDLEDLLKVVETLWEVVDIHLRCKVEDLPEVHQVVDIWVHLLHGVHLLVPTLRLMHMDLPQQAQTHTVTTLLVPLLLLRGEVNMHPLIMVEHTMAMQVDHHHKEVPQDSMGEGKGRLLQDLEWVACHQVGKEEWA
jgi:hypothetical protein